jgi:methyl-accepting chemotaxis protein
MMMTFAKKLYLLIAMALSGLIALGGFSMWQMNAVYDSANYANVNSLPSLEQLDDASQAFFRMRIAVWNHIAQSDPAHKASTTAQIQADQRQIADALGKYEREDISDDLDREHLSNDRSALSTYFAARDAVLALSDAGDFEGARTKQLALQDLIAKTDAALKKHRDYNVTLATQGSRDAASVRGRANLLTSSIALIITAVVGLVGVYLVRQLVTALSDAVRVANAVADGDLAVSIAGGRQDELGKLQDALRQMSEQLTAIIGKVQAGAHAIQSASGEIAQGNLDLSSRTEQQAGALEETASSMEELTSTVQTNADNARDALRLAQEAESTAAQGGQVVNMVVTTMGEISSASNRIVDIIGVIEGISFQTNILALNAAVEAARAGDQGRGFAVVATEVRSLAQRSAAAAKEIKTLIDASSSQVQQGGELVADAGAAMTRIVAAVRQVADVVGNIAEASREQSAGIAQINGAVMQMDGMTQQNAALVEQAAAAAVAMREQAEGLTQMVSHFRLQAHSALPAPRRQPRLAFESEVKLV